MRINHRTARLVYPVHETPSSGKDQNATGPPAGSLGMETGGNYCDTWVDVGGYSFGLHYVLAQTPKHIECVRALVDLHGLTDLATVEGVEEGSFVTATSSATISIQEATPWRNGDTGHSACCWLLGKFFQTTPCAERRVHGHTFVRDQPVQPIFINGLMAKSTRRWSLTQGQSSSQWLMASEAGRFEII